MRVLLDTHTFLWYVVGQTELSKTAYAIIESTENTVFVSLVSLWEVAIKASLSKLEMHGNHSVQALVKTGIEANGLELLTITPVQLDGVRTLPLHHRDPFDRLLVAQALTENLVLLSCDRALSAYNAQVLW